MEKCKNRAVVVKLSWSLDNRRFDVVYKGIYSPSSIGAEFDSSDRAQSFFIRSAISYVYDKLDELGVGYDQVFLRVRDCYTHPFDNPSIIMGFD